MRRLLLILPLVALVGCRTAGPAFFGLDPAGVDPRAARAGDPDVVAVYYDRYGDLYPSHEVAVNRTEFYLRRRGRTDRELRVASVFEKDRTDGTPTWARLLSEAGVADTERSAPFQPVWAEVQSGLRERYAARINGLTLRTDGSRRPLVVLVHGFNNVAAEARQWYDEARRMSRGHAPDAVFLEVYWDGRVSPAPIRAWRQAQYNFPLVGLSFRGILNRVDPAIPVRVITHSSGGPLMASALGDASAALPRTDATYVDYRRRVASLDGPDRPPDMRNLRVAMIAPAMPGLTFANYASPRNVPDRLILGLNSRDIVTTKAFANCAVNGSSCLNARPRTYCTEVAPVFARIGAPAPLVFDFSRSSGATERRSFVWYEAHGMVHYLRRDDMRRVMALLFNDVASDVGEAGEICSPG